VVGDGAQKRVSAGNHLNFGIKGEKEQQQKTTMLRKNRRRIFPRLWGTVGRNKGGGTWSGTKTHND